MREVPDSIQAELQAVLQAEEPGTLERLAAVLIGELLGVSVAVASSGFQWGGDAGPSGRQGRRFRIECKRYGNNTALSERQLLGEMDQARRGDEALEAWILVSTREAPEQLENSLFLKGAETGIPVVIIDWKSSTVAALAALCASSPATVEKLISELAGSLARKLGPAAAPAIIKLRRDLESWSLGYESVRHAACERIKAIWCSPKVSTAELGQNAAGGATGKTLPRLQVESALDAWWDTPPSPDSPALVAGIEGSGKTWAALGWLIGRLDGQPITLFIPSSAVAGLSATVSGLKSFIAERLHELTGVRDPGHWLRRLENLLRRPVAEGPVLTLVFDGLNQEPSTDWGRLFRVLQGPAFSERVRVVATTRTHFLRERLNGLNGLVDGPCSIVLDLYDDRSGGELDQMLAAEGLARADLHPDLVQLARTPRLFSLVIRFREKLVEAGRVTVHRLLWEYGRGALGERAGRSFSETEWRSWLRTMAREFRDGVTAFSEVSLGRTAQRPDLTEHDVYRRLSEIVDGPFAEPGTDGEVQLSPSFVAHALGVALLARLEAASAPTFENLEAELDTWLDPISGLDQRAEILRAAVSILVQRGVPETSIAGVLVTAWLQTQNVTDLHRLELFALSTDLPDALLDAIERSPTHSHRSARLWATNALRSASSSPNKMLAPIVRRARRWCSVVSREVERFRHDGSDEVERQRKQRWLERVGIDRSEPLRCCGVELELVDNDDRDLTAIVPSLLEPFPLAAAAPVFEAVAVALAVARRSDAWNGLKWICWLNERDPSETTQVLRELAADLAARTAESGVHPELPRRAGSLLLWLSGEEEDEEAATALDPGLDCSVTYEADYLRDPGRSWFALERRHAREVLADGSIPLRMRYSRCSELWLDPDFEPPPNFVAEVRAAAETFPVEKIQIHQSATAEDYDYDELVPVLAKCAPDALAGLVKSKIRSSAELPPQNRYWRALHSRPDFLLTGSAEGAAAAALRRQSAEGDRGNEAYASAELFMLELKGLDGLAQRVAIVEADLKWIQSDLTRVLQPISTEQADALIARFACDTPERNWSVLVLLSFDPPQLSGDAWGWVLARTTSHEEHARGLAFRVLTELDPERFGAHLRAADWRWATGEHVWVGHYGSDALAAATQRLPFEEIASRLAPWRLLGTVRLRGSDPNETELAIDILSAVLATEDLQVPDPGSLLTVKNGAGPARPFTYSVKPIAAEEEGEDIASALRRAMSSEAHLEAHRRASDTASKRIKAARLSGASLYLSNMDAQDVELAIRHSPATVERWVEGSAQRSEDFCRRVALAEGAYLAVCEALLKLDPPSGVALWRALREILRIRFIGAANIDALLHLPFRVPDSPEVNTLRDELMSLAECHSDKSLFDVALAATLAGRKRWLLEWVERDRASPLVWRRRRAAMLEGLFSPNELPVSGAWPVGEPSSGLDSLRRVAARRRFLDACARQWWRTYLSAPAPDQAYAAWTLLTRAADRRTWVWMSSLLEDDPYVPADKVAHARLNLRALRKASEKKEKNWDKNFLGFKHVEGVGPWSRAEGYTLRPRAFRP